MALNTYGIDSAMWKMLPVEDQNQIITEYYAKIAAQQSAATGTYVAPAYVAPQVGGYAPTTQVQDQAVLTSAGVTGSSATQDPGTNPGWVFAVNLPSTYPDFEAMKASGSGLVVVADDPNADILVQGARQWGIPVSIQVNAPAGITPEQYAQRVAQAKAQWNPDKLVLDIEDVGKGYAGSAGWEWSSQAASLLQSAVGGTSVAITMPPIQDDYNYAAYQGLGGSTEFWVQSYLGDMTAVDPATARQTLIANGVDPNSITVITGPTQTAPSGMNWASYGIATNTSSAGIYGQGATSNTPYYPGQVPVAGAGSGETPGPAIFVNPYGPYGGGQNTPPPGTVIPGTSGDTTDWAQIYFGSLGLPTDVIGKVDEIFRKNDDPTVASQLALAYIRGTPWYAQTFPGIQSGMKLGLVNDERDYRAYVNAVNQQSIAFQGRAVSGSEIAAYLNNGLNVDTVTRQYAGAADVAVNKSDYNYYLGSFGEGRPSTGDLTALGQQNAGLNSTVGLRVQRAMSQAFQRYTKLFEGTTGTPSLSLGKAGLSAPSLATNTNDIGA